eukprot:591231-Amphidinium_carterae.1
MSEHTENWQGTEVMTRSDPFIKHYKFAHPSTLVFSWHHMRVPMTLHGLHVLRKMCLTSNDEI